MEVHSMEIMGNPYIRLTVENVKTEEILAVVTDMFIETENKDIVVRLTPAERQG